MTLRPPTRLMDDPSVAETLRQELSQLPKSAAMPSGYDAAAGLARFEGSLGITSGANSSSSGVTTGNAATGSGAATGHAVAGSGVGAAATTGAGLKGLLILGAALGLAAAGAGVARYELYSSSSDASARDVAATGASIAVLEKGAAAPIAADTSTATNFAQDTELELVETPKVAKVRAMPSATVATRAVKSLEPSTPVESAPESAALTQAGDLQLKASRSTELAEEMEQLTRLRALATSDPAAALRLSELGDQRFAKGLFRQERQAIAIQSLAQLHRTSEAKRRARAFATAYPRSPFLARMTQLLSSDD